LAFLAYQYAELGINTKNLVGMVFTGHLKLGNIYHWGNSINTGNIVNIMYSGWVEFEWDGVMGITILPLKFPLKLCLGKTNTITILNMVVYYVDGDGDWFTVGGWR